VYRFFAIAIIISVAIVVSVAAAWWIISTQLTVMETPEALRVIEVAIHAQADKWVLKLVVLNEGFKSSEIWRIEVQGVEAVELSEVVKPGEQKLVEVELTGNYAQGVAYTVKLYTKRGNIIPVVASVQG